MQNNGVTNAQKNKWWVLSRQLGHNRARWLTKQVTKGTSSLTHPSMTRWKMQMVLEVMSQAAAVNNEANTIPKSGKIIHLVTTDQKAAIERLKRILKFSPEDFEIMCQRVLKKTNPETHQDAVILMSRMNKAISERKK